MSAPARSVVLLRAVLAVLSLLLVATACTATSPPDAESTDASPSPAAAADGTATDEEEDGEAASEQPADDGSAAAAEGDGAEVLRTGICDLVTCTDQLLLAECVDIEDEDAPRSDQCPEVYAANTDDGLVMQLVVIDLDELVEAGWAVTLEGAAEGLYLDCTYDSVSEADTCASYDFADTLDIEAGPVVGTQLRKGNRAAMVVEFAGLSLDAANDALVLRDPSSEAERTFSGCTVGYGAGPSGGDFVLRGAATCHEAVG